jgi:uncharacterized protein YeaO (DUF488 family)
MRKREKGMALQIKRIYDPPLESDGMRLLVDRLWPRGLSKQRAHLDGWPKELAPSSQLRIWFGHKPENFERFSALYRAELDESQEARRTAKSIIEESKTNTVTLLYAARDPQINHASVLISYLNGMRERDLYKTEQTPADKKEE